MFFSKGLPASQVCIALLATPARRSHRLSLRRHKKMATTKTRTLPIYGIERCLSLRLRSIAWLVDVWSGCSLAGHRSRFVVPTSELCGRPERIFKRVGDRQCEHQNFRSCETTSAGRCWSHGLWTRSSSRPTPAESAVRCKSVRSRALESYQRSGVLPACHQDWRF